MQPPWYIHDSHYALTGLKTRSFWLGLRHLALLGESDVARDLCDALHYVLDRRDIARYPTARTYMDSVEFHLVELPWLLGEGWALGIEHLDKSVPWEILITRRPLPESRPLPP
jgi:hypothetical protein